MTRNLITFLTSWTAVLICAETLTVHVETEGPREGVIAILVFKEKKGFPNKHEHAFLKARFPVPEEGPISCVVTNLPFGDYSLSVLHDINDNYKADKMLGFGPPKEPVGFSNIEEKVLKQPRFKNALITFSDETNELSVPLFYVF